MPNPATNTNLQANPVLPQAPNPNKGLLTHGHNGKKYSIRTLADGSQILVYQFKYFNKQTGRIERFNSAWSFNRIDLDKRPDGSTPMHTKLAGIKAIIHHYKQKENATSYEELDKLLSGREIKVQRLLSEASNGQEPMLTVAIKIVVPGLNNGEPMLLGKKANTFISYIVPHDEANSMQIHIECNSDFKKFSTGDHSRTKFKENGHMRGITKMDRIKEICEDLRTMRPEEAQDEETNDIPEEPLEKRNKNDKNPVTGTAEEVPHLDMTDGGEVSPPGTHFIPPGPSFDNPAPPASNTGIEGSGKVVQPAAILHASGKVVQPAAILHAEGTAKKADNVVHGVPFSLFPVVPTEDPTEDRIVKAGVLITKVGKGDKDATPYAPIPYLLLPPQRIAEEIDSVLEQKTNALTILKQQSGTLKEKSQLQAIARIAGEEAYSCEEDLLKALPQQNGRTEAQLINLANDFRELAQELEKKIKGLPADAPSVAGDVIANYMTKLEGLFQRGNKVTDQLKGLRADSLSSRLIKENHKRCRENLNKLLTILEGDAEAAKNNLELPILLNQVGYQLLVVETLLPKAEPSVAFDANNNNAAPAAPSPLEAKIASLSAEHKRLAAEVAKLPDSALTKVRAQTPLNELETLLNDIKTSPGGRPRAKQDDSADQIKAAEKLIERIDQGCLDTYRSGFDFLA